MVKIEHDEAMEENTELPKQGVIIPLTVRCRDCFHFMRQKASGYKDICSRMGILSSGRPCTKFMPDAKIFSLESDDGRDLRNFISSISATRLSLYASLLVNERVTRRQGFNFGEQIYVRLFREDYLSNYGKAWIIMATPQRVFAQGENDKFRGNFLRASVLDVEQFARKRKALISRQRLIDPNLQSYTRWRPKTKMDVGYEPPVIDGILQESKTTKITKGLKLNKKKDKGMSIINMRG
jgi:hypothetical protein